MQQDSTDRLVSFQLQTLYKLGILERGLDDEEQSRSCTRGLHPHDAFLLAFPPPPAIYSRISHNPERSCKNSSSQAIGLSTSQIFGLSRYKEHYDLNGRTSLRSSSSSVDLPQNFKRDRQTLQICFRYWVKVTRYRRDRDSIRAAANDYSLHNVLTKWAHFLRQRRHDHKIERIFNSWKISRAIAHWANWKQRRHTLRQLLKKGRRSFRGRLMCQRVWQRWIYFTKESQYVHDMLTKRKDIFHYRLVRRVWTELRLLHFRGRHNRFVLYKMFKHMREYYELREQHRLLCAEHHQKADLKRKHRLWQRWRTFICLKNDERLLLWKVQYEVRRRRYFRLWCEVSQGASYTKQLRSKISFRIVNQHFLAWKMLTRASRVGRETGKLHQKRLMALSLRFLKIHANFNVRCRRAMLVMMNRQMATAIEKYQLWVTKQKRRRAGTCLLQQMWHKRLLQWVWLTGLEKVYRKRLAWNQMRRHRIARYFRDWKQFQQQRQICRFQNKQAEELQWKLCYMKAFAGWNIYLKLRSDHTQRLRKAKEHYHMQLLRRGMATLWSLLPQSAHSSPRVHCHRQLMRSSNHECRSCTQSRIKISKLPRHLRQSHSYQNPICNPNRQIWDRWIQFLSVRRQRHHSDRHYQTRRKRQVLLNWNRQIKIRALSLRKRKKSLAEHFNLWKLCVRERNRVGIVWDLAQKVYERKLCTRVIRSWQSWLTHLRQVRQTGKLLHHQRKIKCQTTRFSCQDVIQCGFRFNGSREWELLRACFINWYRHSVKQKKIAQKLAYFHKSDGQFSNSRQQTSRTIRYAIVPLKMIQAQRYWSRWKLFHTVGCIFRRWRQVAAAKASSNSRLEMHLRIFGDFRRQRLYAFVMKEWKYMIQRLRSLKEKQSYWKHQVNREMETNRLKLDQASRYRLMHWYRRWCNVHNQKNKIASDHFCNRLLHNVVTSWWKITLHLKQDKVLEKTQQMIVTPSKDHPRKQPLSVQTKVINNQKKRLQENRMKVAVKDSNSTRPELIRRMLDPGEDVSYSRLFYERSGKESLPNNVLRANCQVPSQQRRRRVCSTYQPRLVEHRNEAYDDSMNIVEGNTKSRQPTDSKKEFCLSSTRGKKAQLSQCVQVLPEDNKSKTHHHDHYYAPSQANDIPLPNKKAFTKVEGFAENNECGTVGEQSTYSVPFIQNLKPLNQPHERDANVLAPSASTANEGHGNPRPHRHAQEIRHGCSNVHQATASLMLKNGGVGRHHDAVVKKMRADQCKKGIKAVNVSSNEATPLAHILQLNVGARTECEEGRAGNKSQWNGDIICDENALKNIVRYYVDIVLADVSEMRGDQLQGMRIRSCFRMVRDFALFRNDFYIDELLKVYNATFQDNSDLVLVKNEEQSKFEFFLEQLVKIHPAYRKYVRNFRQKNLLSVPLNASCWIAQEHLRSLILRQRKARSRPEDTKTYWIWEPLSTDIDASLVILLPIITKYIKVLGQFFLRQAVKGSTQMYGPHDYRVHSTAFIDLMKQNQVFPQLFHRRELEIAVRLSCCSSPDTGELNFPEFIEALVRCSCNLRCGEDAGTKSGSDVDSDVTVIVIKFVMLILAMEGQGSVLRKRNEDISVVLGYLEQKRKKKQAEKHLRFHKLLAKSKRVTSKQQSRPVKNEAELQLLFKNSPAKSAAQSHDTFAELTESWDETSPGRSMTGPIVLGPQTNQPESFVSPPPRICGENAIDCRHRNQNEDTESAHKNSSSLSKSALASSAENAIDISSDANTIRGIEMVKQSTVMPASTECNANLTDRYEHQRYSSHAINSRNLGSAGSKAEVLFESKHHTCQSLSSMIISEEKKTFSDIPTNIEDIIKMFHQPSFTGNNNKGIQIQECNGANEAKNEIRTYLSGHVPSLDDLARGTYPHDYSDWQIGSVSNCKAPVASEVKVRDPMLHFLTESEHFSEFSAAKYFVKNETDMDKPFLK